MKFFLIYSIFFISDILGQQIIGENGFEKYVQEHRCPDNTREYCMQSLLGTYHPQMSGLKNIGNTCYMNSILQPLFATDVLTEYFLNDFEKGRDTPLSNAYYDILLSRKGSPLNPSKLKKQVSSKDPQFMGSRQHDAHEFLLSILNGLSQEMNRVKVMPPYEQIDCDDLPMAKQSQVWENYFKKRDDSVIKDIFQGQLISTKRCELCGHESYTFDNFIDLSVSLPKRGKVKLTDGLKNFVKPEKLDIDGYRCSNCGAIVSITKEIKPYKYPKILVIQLKRFELGRKLDNVVEIPMTLDMSPYSTSKTKGNYRLYGITNHMGTLNSGHYTSQVKDPYTKQWYLCNDASCSFIRGPDLYSKSAYILFYKRDEIE